MRPALLTADRVRSGERRWTSAWGRHRARAWQPHQPAVATLLGRAV